MFYLTCTLNGGFDHCEESYWAKQAGRQERSGGIVGLVGGKREFAGIRLLVADEAVDPEVRDLDRDFVLSGPQGAGDLDAIRNLPYGFKWRAVDTDLRDFLDVAEIEPEMRAGLEPLRRRVDGAGVGGGTGELLHSLIGVIGPRDELSETDAVGRPAIGLEGDSPSVVESCEGCI